MLIKAWEPRLSKRIVLSISLAVQGKETNGEGHTGIGRENTYYHLKGLFNLIRQNKKAWHALGLILATD